MVLETQKYFKYFQKNLFSPGRLNYLILYVTSQCNSSCRTCFFHESLNADNDLSLAEYQRISEKLGNFSVLLLSGGEPFLRKDLREICALFIQRNHADTLSIPTNGLLTDEIVKVTRALAADFPHTVISVNPSLDGMREYHDRLRGVAGCFDRVIETIRALEMIKEKHRNVQMIVNSVVQSDNLEELRRLCDYLKPFNLDYQAFEPLRGDSRDEGLGLPSGMEMQALHRMIAAERKRRARHLFEKVVVTGSLKYIQKIKEDALTGKNWPVACAAGKSIAVIYPDGGVALCELRPAVGNLREHDYDLPAILRQVGDNGGLRERQTMCSGCTHICFLNASLARDWKTMFKIPFYYFKK